MTLLARGRCPEFYGFNATLQCILWVGHDGYHLCHSRAGRYSCRYQWKGSVTDVGWKWTHPPLID